MSSPRYCLRICDGPSCGVQHDSDRLVALAGRTIDGDEKLRGLVVVRSYTCFGRCDDGPNMFVQELAVASEADSDPDLDVLETQRGFYPGMDEGKVVRVLEGHCANGMVVEDLVDNY
jgi:(2Fe-2S) ferredoxin